MSAKDVNDVWLSGNDYPKFCYGLRTLCFPISYVRGNHNPKLLVSRYVLPRAAGLSCAELGPSSADYQPHRFADHSALLVCIPR